MSADRQAERENLARYLAGPPVDRQAELLADARATCERRTAERDRLREAMPVGLAVEALAAQVRRLRRTPCDTMGFDPAADPALQVEALKRELAELSRERGDTEAWTREALDVFTCALHVLIAADVHLADALAYQAGKLGARLDRIDAGGTWAEAKAVEAKPAKVDRGPGTRHRLACLEEAMPLVGKLVRVGERPPVGESIPPAHLVRPGWSDPDDDADGGLSWSPIAGQMWLDGVHGFSVLAHPGHGAGRYRFDSNLWVEVQP